MLLAKRLNIRCGTKKTRVMCSTTVCLLALVLTSLMVAVGNPQKYFPRTRMEPRLSPFEEERRAARRFPRWRSCGINPWEMSGKYEGDLLIANLKEMKIAIRDMNRTWPTTSIPFRIEQSYFFKEEVEEILKSLKEFNSFTCVRLRLATETDVDYILITGKRDGCWSHVGRVGGEQELNLEPPVCVYKPGSIHHQIMHAIGLVHEHNLPGREEYIDIHLDNAVNKDFFVQLKNEEIVEYNLKYDMSSIMHPGRKAFSKNNRSTISTKNIYDVIGQARELSKNDKQKVEIHYGCRDLPDPPTTTAEELESER